MRIHYVSGWVGKDIVIQDVLLFVCLSIVQLLRNASAC